MHMRNVNADSFGPNVPNVTYERQLTEWLIFYLIRFGNVHYENTLRANINS